MKLSFTVLESRDCPSLFVRDGWVIDRLGNDFVPMPDFMASHYSAGDEIVTAIGAAPLGAPRFQIYVDGVKVSDKYAYEDTFRGGVQVAYDRRLVATGAAPTGGPVVVTYDDLGEQIARFFAYHPDFRGGVSVAVANGVVYTVPGPGGGPHVRMFDMHGTPLGDFFGAPPDLRDGWTIIVGDVTHDRIDDFVLVDASGTVHITEGVTRGQQTVRLPAGYTLAGYEGETLTVGNTTNYEYARALWTSFPTMVEFDFNDGAAGQPNPPPTSGTRPGLYRPIGTVSYPNEGEYTTLATIDRSGSIGTEVGTLSHFEPLYDSEGRAYIVTASHGGRSNPYDLRLADLVAPGRLDGTPSPAGVPARVVPIIEGTPYVVDAAAYTPLPGVVLSNLLTFGGESVQTHGYAYSVQTGDTMLAVSRGPDGFVGVGTVEGYQADPVGIRWPNGVTPLIEGQITIRRGAVSYAAPGFSGAGAYRISWTTEGGVRLENVGMIVAGNSAFTFVTPIQAVLDGLGLTV